MMKNWIRRLFKKMDQPQQTGKIIIYGTSWCYGSRRAAPFLDERKLADEWSAIAREDRGGNSAKALTTACAACLPSFSRMVAS